MKLILASASPRRNLILTRLGIPFERITAPARETNHVTPGGDPSQVAVKNARNKALSAANSLNSDQPILVIGADTIVVIDGKILPKPDDGEHAARMLRELSGRKHQVITGLALVSRPEGRILTDYEVTGVTFRKLHPADVDAYVASGEPLDKAGAYGIQGLGIYLVDRIDGDYPNVVGLPVKKLYEMLKTFNVDIFKQSLREKAGTEVNVI